MRNDSRTAAVVVRSSVQEWGRRWRSAAACAAVTVLAVAVAVEASAQGGPGGIRYEPGAPAAERPNLLQDVAFEQMLDAQVPADLVFRDEHGRPVQLGDYFGQRPLILALVYYECPMLCTQVLNGLVSALDILPFDAGREYDVLAVSFNPREGPGLAMAKKESYVARYKRPGTEGGLHFLTGPEASIAQLARAVGFRYTWDPAIKQYAHAAGVVVLTPAGRVSRYFYGIEYSPRDLRLGLVEASERRIGSPVDQLLLYCYHYDPTTGKYGMVAMTAVRIGGALTIGSLLAFWISLWWRGRHPPRLAAAGRRT
jgi:protein SCO1/2